MVIQKDKREIERERERKKNLKNTTHVIKKIVQKKSTRMKKNIKRLSKYRKKPIYSYFAKKKRKIN